MRRKYSEVWKSAGRCVTCSLPSGGKSKCARCIASDLAWKRANRTADSTAKRRKILYEAGRCTSCENVRETNATKCNRCLAYLREYRRARSANVKVYMRAWCQANTAKMTEYSKLRQLRKRSSQGSITKSEWRAIVKAQQGRCIDCGEKRKLEMDHVWPVRHGVCGYAFNIAGRSEPCNIAKHAKLLPGVHPSLFDSVMVSV